MEFKVSAAIQAFMESNGEMSSDEAKFKEYQVTKTNLGFRQYQ